jgi:S1-C subfamily serine protease
MLHDVIFLLVAGMLVVEHVLPGSPADGVLETGDVLVRVNGQVGGPKSCQSTMPVL